jgi:hypothetical protein
MQNNLDEEYIIACSSVSFYASKSVSHPTTTSRQPLSGNSVGSNFKQIYYNKLAKVARLQHPSHGRRLNGSKNGKAWKIAAIFAIS